MVRREAIGNSSLQVAAVLEELGKLLMEEHKFLEAFPYLKECYHIYAKVSVTEGEDSERVAALLCFLHRKIEL